MSTSIVSRAPLVAEFYAGRSIFITGGTGFMGKVLVEKLLRSCPELHTVYLLVRPKRGELPATRVEHLMDSKLFDTLKSNGCGFVDKVVLVTGDLMEESLGISDDDMKSLVDNVSVVFHSAATVRFNEPIRVAMAMNVVGVKRIIELCHRLPKIEALIHVSTAYAYCDRHDVDEIVYPPPVQPDQLLETMKWMDDDMLALVTPKLIHPRPNTYTYTKAVAEHVLLEERGDIPTCIVRPSIVGATYREPFPGWVDNFNGLTGLFVAIGTGILRIVIGDYYGTADIVPVDLAINMMIAAGWHTAATRPTKMPIYNCTTGQLNKVTWGELGALSSCALTKNPVDDVIRIPSISFTKRRLWHDVNMWVSQKLPAGVLDLYLKATGKTPTCMKVHDRIQRAMTFLRYFTLHQWEFTNDNVLALQEAMGEQDQKVFNFDARQIDWPAYLENYCLGTKVFALKEDLADMPKAKKMLNRLRTLHRVVSGVLILAAGRFVVSGCMPLILNAMGDDDQTAVKTLS